jgi:hypothetical protein
MVAENKAVITSFVEEVINQGHPVKRIPSGAAQAL